MSAAKSAKTNFVSAISVEQETCVGDCITIRRVHVSLSASEWKTNDELKALIESFLNAPISESRPDDVAIQ